MSQLDELIQELCPDGVRFIKMGECCTINKGQTPIQKVIPGEYPLVVTTDKRKSSNTYQLDKPSVCIPLVSSRGHGVASLNQVYYQEGKFALGNILCAVTPRNADDLSAKFLYLYLNLKKDVLIVPLMRGGANVSLSMDSLEHIKIPIPPMAVQLEVVRILGKFTELITTLTSELAARKKQYEFYRDKLLSFDTVIGGKNDIHWTVLSKIADIGTGRSNTDEGLEEGLYPFYVRSPEPLRKNEYEYDETAIITAGDGVGVGKVYHYVEGKYALHQRAYRIHINTSDVMPRYYYHYMRSAFLPYIQKTMYHGSVASIRRPMLNEFPVPVPPLDVQERLVRVLDNFDAICSDLNIGLPAEIEARKKQYEFYRDKLLTFDIASSIISGRTDGRTDGWAD